MKTLIPTERHGLQYRQICLLDDGSARLTEAGRSYVIDLNTTPRNTTPRNTTPRNTTPRK